MNIFNAKEYLRYRLRPTHKGEVLPASVHAFYKALKHNTSPTGKELAIEKLRDKLKSSKEEITLVDYGAGSKVKSKLLTVAKRAKYSLKPQKQARIIGKIAKWSSTPIIIELGTSFGLTTAYLASNNPNAKVYTLEGDPTSAALAKRHFLSLELSNIQLLEGSFEELLPKLIPHIKSQKCLVFIDGNHQGKALTRYLDFFMMHCSPDSIYILDDINWSKDMLQAWKNIIHDQNNYYKVDMFHIGVLIPAEGQENAKDYYQLNF